MNLTEKENLTGVTLLTAVAYLGEWMRGVRMHHLLNIKCPFWTVKYPFLPIIPF